MFCSHYVNFNTFFLLACKTRYSTSSHVNEVEWLPTQPSQSPSLDHSPFIDIVAPYSAFYYYHHAVIHISPCEQIKEQSFSLAVGLLHFVVFISCTWMKRAWGKKTMLSAWTPLAAWHRGIRHRQGSRNILSDVVALCRNLWEAAVTHLVVSSNANDDGSSALFVTIK